MKVLFVKNRLKKKLSLDRGLEWFKQTPLSLQITEIETDFDFTYQEVGNGKAKGFIPKASSLFPKLRNVAQPDEYDIVCIFHENDCPGVRVSNAYSSKLWPGTRVMQTYRYNDGGLTFNHEFIHVLFKLLADKGVRVDDPMDFVTINGKVKAYYNNKNLNAKVSNRTIALERLATHWDLLCPKLEQGQSRLETVLEFILKEEGGYVNNPKDPGGETKYGISKRSYPKLDIKALTKKQAEAIYMKDYWEPCKCEMLPQGVDIIVMDMAVNMGKKTAVQALQGAVGATTDGVIGKKTLSAVQKLDSKQLASDLTLKRIEKYAKMKNFPTFGRGWVLRAIRCYNN